MELLLVKDLHVKTRDTGQEILKGVDLTINRGEVHAVMGPNGSGKSTLANAIMGNPAYEIVSGEIFLDGEDIAHLPVDERARKGLFLSFQQLWFQRINSEYKSRNRLHFRSSLTRQDLLKQIPECRIFRWRKEEE